MSLVRVNVSGWSVGDKLLSSQVNGLDINGASALDKRTGQTDTLHSTVTLDGTGGLSLTGGYGITTAGGAIHVATGAGIVVDAAGGISITGTGSILANTPAAIAATATDGIEGLVAGAIRAHTAQAISSVSAGGISPGVAGGINIDVAGGLVSSTAGAVVLPSTSLIMSDNTGAVFATPQSHDYAQPHTPIGPGVGTFNGYTCADVIGSYLVLPLSRMVHGATWTVTRVRYVVTSGHTPATGATLSIGAYNPIAQTYLTLATASPSSITNGVLTATLSMGSVVVDRANHYFVYVTTEAGSAAQSLAWLAPVCTFTNITNVGQG